MDRPVTLQSKEGAAAAVYVVKNSPLATYRAYGPLATLRFDLTTDRDETRAYDFRNQPTSITVSGSLFTLNYTTDDVGNITQQQRTLPAPTETRGYGYQDWQYYLTCGSGPWGGTACSPAPGGNPLEWTYDKIGNRATEVRAGVTDSYVYDDNSGATGDTAVLDVVNLGVLGTRDYAFDTGGYLTQIAAGANVLDFTFDEAGQLAEVERPAATQDLTMAYDGRGFLSRADDAASGGYVQATYSSAGLLHSLERLPTTAGTVERHNVLYFAGRPIAIWKKVGAAAAATTYVITDHLGTPVYALNQAGTEFWKGGLEPFGRDWQEGTANDMLTKGIFLRFPGQWDDGLLTNATLGGDIYYNVHRWAEPQTGRYSSPDPLISMTLWPSRENQDAFLYARARPTVMTDPLGLCALDPTMEHCLTFMFGEPVSGVQTKAKPRPNARWAATTRRDRIITYTGCDEFFGDPAIVLEEYYHVLRQWNRGRMTRTSWAIETARNGYENNRFEREAWDFVETNLRDFEDCLKCPTSYPRGIGGVLFSEYFGGTP
jgi:RHS repeat-associated protein